MNHTAKDKKMQKMLHLAFGITGRTMNELHKHKMFDDNTMS